MDKTIESRAKEIAKERDISYLLALMFAMSERGEFRGDLIVVDEGKEYTAVYVQMESDE